ncbi:cytochrome b/b6 domain-containing protein [Mesorhizobium sp. LNHC221B00]|uniref:cytochrome b n=2 Tax=Mesorhizobium TaxID=68287 RepID=UPI00268EF245
MTRMPVSLQMRKLPATIPGGFAPGAPRPADRGPVWMRIAARGSHGLFYLVLLATPIVGLLAFYVGDPWGDIHSLSKPVFIVLISVHALAALFHQYWLRDGTLKRMLSPGR